MYAHAEVYTHRERLLFENAHTINNLFDHFHLFQSILYSLTLAKENIKEKTSNTNKYKYNKLNFIFIVNNK